MAVRVLTVLPVTPHVGVWIETKEADAIEKLSLVTPHVGVWIETLWPRPAL